MRAIAGKAIEAILNVSGVPDLAHLAVVDDVDTGLDLARHHRSPFLPHCTIESRAICEFAAVLGV